MFYYEIHVNIEYDDYSFVLKSNVELDEDERISLAIFEKKFEQEYDEEFIDYNEEISEEEYNKW